jgi:dihydrofolate reductase
MHVNLIWAQAHNRVIGLNGKMPWHLPEDLAHFKKTTLGHPVIMGRKTWDSLPGKFRPLPGRKNLVISSDAATRGGLKQIGVLPAEGLREALSICEHSGEKEVWVIGGARIYAQALPLAHKLVVTEIDAEFFGDAFAPVLDANWRKVAQDQQTAANGIKVTYVTYLRT